MIDTHKYCVPPDNPNIMIWKYLDFTKFIDLLTTKKLFFSRFDKFEDEFEGSLPSNSALARLDQMETVGIDKDSPLYTEDFWTLQGQEFKKRFAACCWHMNNHESAAMWKVYLKSNEGVAIQSTYQKLYDCLNKSKNSVYLSIVQYKDFETEIIDWGNRMVPFVHKRNSYSFEQELRAIIRSWDGYDLEGGGFKIDIDINSLIENVYVAPSSPVWFSDLVKRLVADLNLNVLNSKLDDRPIY
jgi:hypothetical protein